MYLNRSLTNQVYTWNKFQTTVSVRNWISLQWFLSLAYCLFREHRYMNYDNKAGVYPRQGSWDQFSVDKNYEIL